MHEFWDQLDDQGGSKGYSPYPIKFILVTGNHTLSRAKEYFSGLNLNIINGNQYMRSWIMVPEVHLKWIQDKFTSWVAFIKGMDTMATKFSLNI